jgi:hypothetical protein
MFHRGTVVRYLDQATSERSEKRNHSTWLFVIHVLDGDIAAASLKQRAIGKRVGGNRATVSRLRCVRYNRIVKCAIWRANDVSSTGR